MKRNIGLWLVLVLCFAAGYVCADTVKYGAVVADTGDTYLDMGNTVIEKWGSFYTFLEQFPELKKVDMFATRVDRKKIAEIVERFPDIEFGWTIRLADHVIRTDQTAFSTLHASDTPWMHSEIEFGVLKYCKQLKALDIGHNIIKDVSFLYDLPQLRVLIIALNQIKDITPVGSLKNLEYLEVFMNYVEDISPLMNCTHLMDLNISKNNITDLTPLHSMKSLKRLWMRHYNRHGVSGNAAQRQAKIDELQAALPDCQINNTSDSTEDGWRKPHPHYDVIYRMFHTGVYEPFEDSYPEESTERTITVVPAT